ncbi:uncharacterized protein BX664DRAFT_333458 [Halteromyces radiatus]|uniref:uncharacterized protein n=1 Tax=Halteromyces radiatus TaxID=101107 RepID=UPI00221E6AAE|nr:uncharacterized protein BX664DRAFT_333458 [Halteromyces radiatus]KAI8089611.1 hypothetical protein BX664DRAFT_333458 [Halteromyces radiatus]
MPATQKKQRSSKLFQCSGFGDCKMVFTRGEHLARHTRKHTGEKPFLCIVPDCNKTFSRFDNMMQHTQTHLRNPIDNQQRQQRQQKQSSCPSLPTVDKDDRVILQRPSSIVTSDNHQQYQHHLGPASPSSLCSTSLLDSSSTASSSDDEDDDDDVDDHFFDNNKHHWITYRRLSIADMCNPMDESPTTSSIDQLSRDEVEVIQAFGKLRQATY